MFNSHFAITVFLCLSCNSSPVLFDLNIDLHKDSETNQTVFVLKLTKDKTESLFSEDIASRICQEEIYHFMETYQEITLEDLYSKYSNCKVSKFLNIFPSIYSLYDIQKLLSLKIRLYLKKCNVIL